jgi:hypothetical protein
MTNTMLETMTVYEQMCIRIIQRQETIVGVLSWNEAAKVEGLSVNRIKATVKISGEPKKVVDELINLYVQLFGRLSREVSRESVVDLTAEIPVSDIPSSLK